ncbi:MAG: CPBP family glutamic-type intramembrane protease [Methanosarcina sp.]
MRKPTNYHNKQKKLNIQVIVSVLTLTLLAISAHAAPGSSLELSPSTDTGHLSEQIYSEVSGETENSVSASVLHEDPDPLQKIEQYVDIIYTAGGIGAAVLILIGYLHMTSGDPEVTKKYIKGLPRIRIRKITGPEEPGMEKGQNVQKVQENIQDTQKVQNIQENVLGIQNVQKNVQENIQENIQEEFKAKRLRLLTALPVLGITIAELLIFSGRMGAAVWVHIGIVISLSLSDIFLKDPEVHRIYQALMLLPVLRLINLSMPIFFETTLYTFMFVYGPLAIPVIIIILHQRDSLEQIGITMKNFVPYMLIAVPLGFLLGFGEYLTIRSGYLIPDLTFVNLLKLTFIMVFFVGLVEELIFRSILQSRLEKSLSVREALLITSLMFGLMHSGYGTFQEILYTGFVGLIMGLAFYKTRSLPFIAVLHGFVNVFLFGILPHQLNILPGL